MVDRPDAKHRANIRGSFGAMTDAPHRANVRGSFGVLLVLLVILSGAACTTRQVYDTASNMAPVADAININTATAQELERLPRIGPKTAASIIKFRTDNGPFRQVEELMQVHGISEKKFLEIRQYLRAE